MTPRTAVTSGPSGPATHPGGEPTAAELRARCARAISGHRPVPPDQWLTDLATSPYAKLGWDRYGEGALVRELEERVGALLGTEAAVFVPKGVIAQQAVLRVWCERAGSPLLVVHPRSHLDLDEGGAYEALHRLQPRRVGEVAPFTVADLAGVHERVGAVTVELPLRRASFQLPTWDQLAEIAGWAREHRAALHLDGARLWACEPYYGRSVAQVAALADSVYASLYKDVGGLAGCVLGAPADVVAETRVWLDRHGGLLYSALPYLVSALEGLDRQLPRLAGYVGRARDIAAALVGAGLVVVPDPPQTNGFTVAIPAPAAAVEQACRAVATERGVFVAGRAVATALPEVSLVEVQVGEASEDLSDAEIVEVFAAVATRASDA